MNLILNKNFEVQYLCEWIIGRPVIPSFWETAFPECSKEQADFIFQRFSAIFFNIKWRIYEKKS
jgi:hypothetical protein